MALLFLRRYLKVFGRGELGGPSIPKYLTFAVFVTLWLIYITLSALQAYGYIAF
jgi:solute carrier family 8 (sodium/calcium exchanger)